MLYNAFQSARYSQSAYSRGGICTRCIHVPWIPLSQHPRLRLDRFSRFCTAHDRESIQGFFSSFPAQGRSSECSEVHRGWLCPQSGPGFQSLLFILLRLGSFLTFPWAELSELRGWLLLPQESICFIRLPVNSSHHQLVTWSTRHNSSHNQNLGKKRKLCLIRAIFNINITSTMHTP